MPFRPLRLAVACLILGLAAAPALADYVFLTDGTTLYGKLRKEGELFSDVGADYWAPKVGWVMDDGVRKIYFHQRLASEAQRDPPNAKTQFETFTLKQPNNPFQGPLQNISLDAAGPWQADGMRKVQVRARLDAKQEIQQYITEATPSKIIAKARIHRWAMPLLPNEVGPKDLFTILKTHPDALGKEPDSEASLARLLRYSLEAGWLDEADKLRQEIAKAQPNPNPTIARLFVELDRQLAFRADQQIQLAARAGQHLRAQQLLDTVKDDHASDAVLTRLRTARNRYKQQNAELQTLRRLVMEVRKAAKAPSLMTAARPVLDEIEQELNLDTAVRLEVFLRLAQQEEKLKSAGKEPEYSPDQLIALAVTGWMMGPKGADAKEAYAILLCQARDFLARYLKTEKKEDRAKLLYQYTRGEVPRVDEMAQLIELLPPLDPAPAEAAAGVADRETPKSERWPRGVRYKLRRPSEYHPHRAYPLLLVLPNMGQVAAEPAELLKWWGPEADRYGYLLAVPEWAAPGQKAYDEATPREHAAVHEVIRDIRRRDHVDGERIALAGFDQSGLLTYDVALGRPDQFAAAVVICGSPGLQIQSMQNNAQYLPFYVVDGEKDFLRPQSTRKRLFEHWLTRGFPSLYCEYFQRGYEDYRHEIPYILDFISRKKVARGLPELGREVGIQNLGEPMRCLRPWDNRIYWLTTDGHTGTSHIPAELTAKQVAGNSYVIKAKGFKQLSVWLSPAMADFEQPVEIKINPGGGGPTFKKAVKPSLEVLLEDFLARGDQKNLYFAKVDFDLAGKR